MTECGIHGSDCPLDEEVIVLEAIYIDELDINRDDNDHVNEVRLVLHPATADETDRQFVKITLVIKPSLDYPEQLPEIQIENSRGLSDNQIKCLSQALNLHAESKRGWPMLHELIETAKDTLTAGNLPHCPCAICLDHFTAEDEIYKTVCYHYYHPDCLIEYVDYYRRTLEEPTNDRTIPCPICREDIEVDLPSVTIKKKVETENVEYVPDAYVKALQEKMQQMYLKQKEKGGIIDIEAEKNKFLVQNGTVVLPREYVEDSEERYGELVRESQARAAEDQRETEARDQKTKPYREGDKRKYLNHSRRGRNLHSAARESDSRRGKPDTRPKQRDTRDDRRWSEPKRTNGNGESSHAKTKPKTTDIPRNRNDASVNKQRTSTTEKRDSITDKTSVNVKTETVSSVAQKPANDSKKCENESESGDDRKRKQRRDRKSPVEFRASASSETNSSTMPPPGFQSLDNPNNDDRGQSSCVQSRDAHESRDIEKSRDRDKSRDAETLPPGISAPPGFNGVHHHRPGRGRGRGRGVSLEDRAKILKKTSYGRGFTMRGGDKRCGRGRDMGSEIIGQDS